MDIEARNELDDVQDGGAEAEAATSAEGAVSDAGAPETATA